MRKGKKTTVMLGRIVALILLFSVLAQLPAFAVTPADESLQVKIRDGLAFLESEKELYGLDGVDFTNLSLGAQIPAYVLSEQGLSFDTEVAYYPIIENGYWILTAAVAANELGEDVVTISTDFADASLSLNNRNELDAVLIFDENTAFVCTNDKLIPVATYAEEANRKSIADCATDILLTALEIDESQSLKQSEPVQIQLARATYPNTHGLSVSMVTQIATNSCWSAVIMSALSYYGKNVSVNDVYAAAGVTKYEAASAGQAALAVEVLGFHHGINTAYSGYYSGSLTIDIIKKETYDNSAPLFAAFGTGGSTIGHAVAIRGYSEYDTFTTPYASYMDPASGSFKVMSIPSTGKPVYVNASGTSLRYETGFAIYR